MLIDTVPSALGPLAFVKIDGQPASMRAASVAAVLEDLFSRNCNQMPIGLSGVLEKGRAFGHGLYCKCLQKAGIIGLFGKGLQSL